MIDNSFKSSFSRLNTIEKRNQINNELLFIASLIKMKEEQLKLPSILNVKNYDSNKQSKLTENDMLDFLYEDIYSIKRELITLLSVENR
ncbi:MAG: hypothetical protein SPJ27_09675 [Candidatus Onthovivens sp.]|nr:hypothetical protein [Candidatus Onthovivens sp.]